MEDIMNSTVKLTRYYCVNEEDYNGDEVIPVLDINNNTIANVSGDFFAAMSLEGSAKLADTRVLNVTGKYAPCPSNIAQILKDIADSKYHSHYGYVGLSQDLKKYFVYSTSPTLWGVGQHNFALVPFVSVASDQRFYPFGTVLYIPTLKGLQMPDGTTHAGYVYCCDTGSAIVGEHLDWFVGYRKWQLNSMVPDEVEVQVYSMPNK
jgi:3D (Asp-Asp-Asp) domain-containing protein